MTVPPKPSWRATANGGDPRFAADGRYATTWASEPSKSPWIEIDLGAQASLDAAIPERIKSDMASGP
jgi:hypothetical protein